MFEQKKLEQIVDEVLYTLPLSEFVVLNKRCGRCGEPMTQKDLGIELYISTSRVGQIEAKALQRICWHHPDKVKELQPFLYQVLSRRIP